jgi:hypothetical protein
MWDDTYISEAHAASIFTIKMEEARSSEMLSCCNITHCHNTEDLKLNLHHHKNLKSHTRNIPVTNEKDLNLSAIREEHLNRLLGKN